MNELETGKGTNVRNKTILGKLTREYSASNKREKSNESKQSK